VFTKVVGMTVSGWSVKTIASLFAAVSECNSVVKGKEVVWLKALSRNLVLC